MFEGVLNSLATPVGIFVLFGTGFLSFKTYDLFDYYGETRNLASNLSEVLGYGCVNVALSLWWLFPFWILPIYSTKHFSASAITYAYPLAYCLIVQPVLLGLIPAVLQTIARSRNAYFLPMLSSAWDWTFSRAGEFTKDANFKVVVNMDDGSRIAGTFSKGSYASSINGNQLYLSRLVQITEDGSFREAEETQSRGVIVLAKNVSSVELYPGSAKAVLPRSAMDPCVAAHP